MDDFRLPGARSKGYAYGDFYQQQVFPIKPREKPLCDWGVTAGEGTVRFCPAPYDGANVVSCPMTRPLIPERNCEGGLWTLPPPSPPTSPPTSPVKSPPLDIDSIKPNSVPLDFQLGVLGLLMASIYFFMVS